MGASSQIVVDHSWMERSYEECAQECGENSTCIKVCQKAGFAVGLTLGLAGFIIILVLGVCICFRRHMCLFMSCHKYQDLKKQFNQVSPGDMKEKEFVAICNKIV